VQLTAKTTLDILSFWLAYEWKITDFPLLAQARNIALYALDYNRSSQTLHCVIKDHKGVRQFLLRRSLAAASSLQELPDTLVILNDTVQGFFRPVLRYT
jgi:hypothetical protein